jgi:hypothetical protein
MGPTTAAVFNDTCGNLIQIYQVFCLKGDRKNKREDSTISLV